jgi:hypothetical protein
MSTLSFDDHGTWLDYKSRIITLHSNFFKSLATAHPHLKEKQTMLCALVLDEADTEQIAFYLNMQVRAVRAMKKKLKQDMGLAEKESLHAHLIGLC